MCYINNFTIYHGNVIYENYLNVKILFINIIFDYISEKK